MPDDLWLPIAGREGYLTISHDLNILNVPAERAALVDAGAGIVLLDAGNELRWKVLRFVLDRWEWLEDIDANVTRPFAFRAALRGRPRQVVL